MQDEEPKYESEDWARLAVGWHSDAELAHVCEAVGEAFGREFEYLPMLYWPRVITAAKSAKSFGWFRTSLRQLATSVRDRSPDNVRQFVFEQFIERGLLELGKREQLNTDGEVVDLRPTEFGCWQSMSVPERKRLQRARQAAEQGKDVPWTVSHLVTACHALSRAVTKRHAESQHQTRPDETKQDQKKESTSDSDKPNTDQSDFLNVSKKVEREKHVDEVLDHWKLTFDKQRSKTTGKAGAQRRGKVRARLAEGFTVDQLKSALTGFSKSRFHVEKGYVDVMTLLRDGPQVEKGIELATNGPPGGIPAGQFVSTSNAGNRHTLTENYDDDYLTPLVPN